MALGMTHFTAIQGLSSLIGIVSGLIVLFGLITANAIRGWTLVFIVATLATSVTGFFFPFHGFTPALGVGILSLFILLAAIAARCRFHLTDTWRWVYVVGVVTAPYFNSFVPVVQAFLKIPGLHMVAPNGSEPPFALAQGLVLTFYFVTGALAIKGFRSTTRSVGYRSPGFAADVGEAPTWVSGNGLPRGCVRPVTKAAVGVDFFVCRAQGIAPSPPSQVRRDHLLTAQRVDLSALAKCVGITLRDDAFETLVVT
jgi:hypothetical protein